MAKKEITKKTYTVWTTVEEHIEYSDGSEDFKDIEELDDVVSAGRFDTIQEARLRVGLIGETFGGDFTE